VNFSQEGLIAKISDPYNLIRHTESFLSRSTQESGLTKKNEEKSQPVKAIPKKILSSTLFINSFFFRYRDRYII